MSVTYRHARTFTFGDSQLTLEIGNSRKREKGREKERERERERERKGEGRGRKKTKSMRDDLRRRMCENRRSAFNGHPDAQHHHWSRSELLWEERRKSQMAVRNYKWWQKRKSSIKIYFFLFESIYIYRRDFYTFFLSMDSSRENVMRIIVKYFRLSAIGELTKVFFCLT